MKQHIPSQPADIHVFFKFSVHKCTEMILNNVPINDKCRLCKYPFIKQMSIWHSSKLGPHAILGESSKAQSPVNIGNV